MSELNIKNLFLLQEEFMQMLEERDKLPPWPVDLTTKNGQRMIKEITNELHGEIWEATHTLKNKAHRMTDDREFDFAHYLEELGDAFAYFMEVCIMSGITPEMLSKEYVRKNGVVKARLRDGY